MEIPYNAFESILEQMRQIQIELRSIGAELEKWKQECTDPAVSTEIEPESVFEPPTEKRIQFLKSLGIDDIPTSKEEARCLLQELNEKLETGEYSIPPTAKQLKFLRNLKYNGPIPESKEAAWRLLQELSQRE